MEAEDLPTLWLAAVATAVPAGRNDVLELRNNLSLASSPASLPFSLYASAQQDRAKMSKQRFEYKPFFYTERGYAACALTFIERG
jgi:hypothetical protein